MTNIIIREDWRGQSGGQYYYVKEENIHRRIEKYANFRGEVYGVSVKLQLSILF
jgi:hypothetical protein